jgi:ketosteroid isomerase-like protein
LEYFGQLAHETKGSLRVEPQTVAASGDRVFVLERLTGERKGEKLDATEVVVFTLDKGIVTEASSFQSNYPVVSKFWS